MRYALVLWLGLVCCVQAGEMPGETRWQIQQADSLITFSVLIQGVPSEGAFPKFSGDIIFDPDRLEGSRIDILIDLNHIDAFFSDVATNLKKEPWFDVANFPTARFVSHSLTSLGGRNYQATGELTLRGVTRPEVLSFTLTDYDEQTAAIIGKMVLNRLDYGVGQGAWRDVSTVAGQVFLGVMVKATKK
ncbi:MAG: polyisoprenoid-binding protein [Alphaproteobacteria bacterium]|nr:MAG: polyisoprenoid-binding protein [Alphaproteobacteria bacterium]